jgi:hypothetical protein
MSARAAPRLTAVVLFPTPPFWFAIAMILACPGTSGTVGARCFADRLGRGGVGSLDRVGDAGRVLADALVTIGP